MKNKTALIEISGLLDLRADYFSFYEFSVNYIFNLKGKNCSSSDFFSSLKRIADNPNIRENFSAFGKQGKGSDVIIKSWATMMCSHPELKKLDLDELHYVMGYCARRSKITSGR